jgi:hypothetical protein
MDAKLVCQTVGVADFCKNYGKSMSKNIYIFLKNVVLMLLKCIGKNERRSSPRVPNNLKYRR